MLVAKFITSVYLRGCGNALCVRVCVVLPVHFEASQDLLFFPRFARTPKGVSSVKNASFNRCREELAALLSCMSYCHGELAALVCGIMSVDSHLFLLLDMYCEASIFRGGGGRARSLLHALLNFDVAAAWSITLASEQVCILISFESSCVEQVTASLLCMHALTQSQFRCYIFIVLPHM